MKKQKTKRLVFLVNVDWFFLSHRLPLALEALSRNYDVTVVAADTGFSNLIREKGIDFVSIPLERSGTNLFKELNLLLKIFKILKKLKPDIIHNVALKACLYGGMISRLFSNLACINAVSGVGFIFTTESLSLKQKVFAKVMKLGFPRKAGVIFQNPDDYSLFISLGVIKNNPFKLIKGSGVDIRNKFKFHLQPENNKLVVLFPARMLFTKGLLEFCKAAELLHSENLNARFVLVGGVDVENKSSVSTEELKNYEKEYNVEWHGHSNNIKEEYVKSDIVVLPSYREGLPKSLIEACAIGRPIITTDAPGCRECVNGRNGFLVPVGDHIKLADKLKLLLSDNEIRRKMGEESRKLAESEFSIETVIEKTFEFYSETEEKK